MNDEGSRAAQLDPEAGRSRLDRWLPGVAWMRRLGGRDVLRDASVGCLVAFVLLPQAVAYALLAELPPEVGIFACLLPAVAYALLGTSRHVAVGPILGNEGVRSVLLDLASVEAVDASALEMLEELQETLADADILLALAHPQSDVEKGLRQIGFFDRLGPENVYLRVEDTIEDLESRCS